MRSNFFKLIFLIILIYSCGLTTTKTTNRYPFEQKHLDKTYVSPYIFSNFLSKYIITSDDADHNNAFIINHAIFNLIKSSNLNIQDFFSLKKNEKIKFYLAIDSEENADCYIQIKTPTKEISFESSDNEYKNVDKKFDFESEFEKCILTNNNLDSHPSFAYFVIAELKRNKIKVTGYSLCGY